ncbi:MAG: DMT family transporter [Peptococcaceae bacterium]|nr:DMT family transporter [Peptococcaceae bacterium]
MQPRYIVLTIIAAIGWGFSGTCGEHLFKTYSTNGEWLTSARLLSAGTLLLIITVLSGQGKALVGIVKSKRDLPQLLLFAIFGMMAVQYTYLTAIAYTNSGTATVLQYSGPAFVLFYVCLSVRRLPSWREGVSLVGIIIGVFLIATHGDVTNLVISRPGLFWGMLSAIFLAVHDILPVGIIKRWGSLPVTAWSMFFGGIILTLLTRPFDYSPVINVDTVLTFTGLVVVGTVFAFTAFLTGVSHIGPVNASIICCIEPIAASIFSFLWVGTHFTLYDISGMIIILIAVFILTNAPNAEH